MYTNTDRILSISTYVHSGEMQLLQVLLQVWIRPKISIWFQDSASSFTGQSLRKTTARWPHLSRTLFFFLFVKLFFIHFEEVGVEFPRSASWRCTSGESPCSPQPEEAMSDWNERRPTVSRRTALNNKGLSSLPVARPHSLLLSPHYLPLPRIICPDHPYSAWTVTPSSLPPSLTSLLPSLL